MLFVNVFLFVFILFAVNITYWAAVAQRNEQVILSRFDPRLLQSVSPCILGQDTEP